MSNDDGPGFQTGEEFFEGLKGIVLAFEGFQQPGVCLDGEIGHGAKVKLFSQAESFRSTFFGTVKCINLPYSRTLTWTIGNGILTDIS